MLYLMESLILQMTLIFDKVLIMEEDVLKSKTILVVDDETDLRDIVASELEFMGAKVFQAENILNAQKILSEEKIDLIISDIRMPGGTGIDLLNIIKARNESAPVILITGFADITTEDAFDKGAEALMNKPFKLDDLIKMAVRYTSPIEERFHEQLDSDASIKIDLQDTDIQFGRGGVSFVLDTKDKRINVGEVVKFDLNFHNQTFSGQGVCRWLRANEHGSGKALMGLEFVNLDDKTFNNFGQMFTGKKVIPYIPAFKN